MKKEKWSMEIAGIFFLVIFCLVLAAYPKVMAEEQTPPTIEELTNGKIKVGDLITKENVDLVKDYLSVAIYEQVRRGMVLEMAANVAPWAMVPKFFQEATDKSLKENGPPVINESAVIYTKEGKPWPGGLPFPDPKNGLEIIANYKYGHAVDDWGGGPGIIQFIDKDGKMYKDSVSDGTERYCHGRLTVPPLGTIPGMEQESERALVAIKTPRENRGLGQITIKYWDDEKEPDKGFVYLPAFKRIIRISATTWQDNFAGSDITWGDFSGLYEPAAYWNFKLIERKIMIVPSLDEGKGPEARADGVTYDVNCPMDVGMKYARHKWAVYPIDVIEATPKGKHIYGKKIIYMSTPAFWPTWCPIRLIDIYDAQMKLWKGLTVKRETEQVQNELGSFVGLISMHDLQTGHATHLWQATKPNIGGSPADLSLDSLIAAGR